MKTLSSKPGIWERMNHWIPWRMLIMSVMLLIVVIVTPRVLDLGIPAEPSAWRPSLVALRNLLVAGAMAWIYAFSVKLLERRPAIEVKPRPLDLFTGTLIGAALISAVYAGLWVTGHASFAAGTGTTGLFTAIAGVFGAALVEPLASISGGTSPRAASMARPSRERASDPLNVHMQQPAS